MDTFISILIITGIVIMSVLSCGTISHIFCCIINKTTSFQYGKKLLLLNFFVQIPVCLINQLLTLYLPTLNILKPVLILLTFFIVAKFIYKSTLQKSLLCSVSCILLSSLLDILYSIVIISLGYSITTFTISPIKYLMFSILFNILQILIPIIIYRLFKRNNHFSNNHYINNIKNSEINIDYKYIFYQFIIILICLLPSTFLLFSKTYDYPISFLIVNIVQVTIASCVGFVYTKNCILHKQTKQELENTKLYNNALTTINENVRGFKHDMGNIVQSINGYISINNLEGVREYCQGLLKGFNDINILSVLSPRIINNPAIYGIVVGKILLAREKSLTLTIDINCDVEQINFPKFELSRILGILLDNAIEACENSEDKKLSLHMFYDNSRHSDIIVIGNSVKDVNTIDILKMFNKDYSTKKNPSGFGLYEVIKFLRKHDKGDIIPNIDYDKNFFTQTLVFQK